MFTYIECSSTGAVFMYSICNCWIDVFTYTTVFSISLGLTVVMCFIQLCSLFL